MTDAKLIFLAATFLHERGIAFVKRGRIGREVSGKVEVIFPVPETLNPSVAAVAPPVVRVWVTLENDEVELIPPM